MIKKVCLIILCLIPLVNYAMEEMNSEDFKRFYSEKSAALQNATDKYLDFIKSISQGEIFSQMDSASSILAPNCKKILNGMPFKHTREEFINDLFSVYEKQGPWKVHVIETFLDPLNSSVILRIFIEMKDADVYTAMVILRYDSNNLIVEINEVLSPVKGSYDFKNE